VDGIGFEALWLVRPGAGLRAGHDLCSNRRRHLRGSDPGRRAQGLAPGFSNPRALRLWTFSTIAPRTPLH